MRLLMIVLLLMISGQVLAAPATPKAGVTFRLRAVSEDVTSEDLGDTVVILIERLSEAGVNDIAIEAVDEGTLEVRLSGKPELDILLLLTQVGLLELVDFSGLVEIPVEGDCILTTGQLAYGERPLCAGEDDFKSLGGEPYQAIIDSTALEDVVAQVDSNSIDEWRVSFTLTEEASELFAEFTTAHIDDPLAIVLDGEVISVPTILARIEGEGQIVGNFTEAEAENLATVLKSGALPVQFEVEEVE